MLRATIWTVGLFGAGTALTRLLAWPWAEPVVLLALGAALLWASARSGVRERRARAALAPKEAAA
jgi:cytochrome c-type biogenesis protein CcmH/NrfF